MRAGLLIGMLGGECTGKSALARALAGELGAVVVPEALRAFVDAHGRPPAQAEQAGIMAEQARAVREAQRRPGAIVVADPLPAMTAAYSAAYFGDHDLDGAARRDIGRCDLVAWCQPDFPWEPDGIQRDGEEMRAAGHAAVAALLAGTDAAVVIAAGPLAERVASIREALARLGS